MLRFNKKFIVLMVLVIAIFQTTASFAETEKNSKESEQTIVKMQSDHQDEQELSLTPNTQNSSEQGLETVIPLSAPSGLKVVLSTNSTVQLEWKTPSDYVAHSYEIYMNELLHATIEGDKTTYTVTSLDPETTYAFKIRAMDVDNAYSSFSDTVTVSTSLEKLADSMDSNLKLKSDIHSDTTATLSWSYPELTPTNSTKSYEIYVNDILNDTILGTKTSYTVTDLSPANTYSFQMRAIYQDESSETSNSISVTTLSGMKVYEVASSSEDNHSGKTIDLIESPTSSAGTYLKYNADSVGDWYTIPFEADQGNYKLDLRLWKGPDMGIAQIVIDDIVLDTNVDFYSQSGEATNVSLGQVTLDERKDHTIRLNVVDKNPESSGYALGLDALYLTQSQAATVPSVPTHFNSPIQSDTSINLAWDAVNPADSVETYQIYVNDNLLTTIASDKTFYIVKDVIPGTEYTYKIRSLNKEGLASEFSDPIVVSTLLGKQIIEFENLSLDSINSGKKQNLIEDPGASAGRWLDYEALEIGDFVEFPFTLEKGQYEVDLRILQKQNNAIVAVSIDGVLVSDTVDFFNMTSEFADISLGSQFINNQKSHTIRFEVIGKNENSTGYGISVDAIYLTPTVKDTFEPNDTIEQATLLEVSKTLESYISSSKDIDYYKFVAPKDNTYFITLHSPEDVKFKQEFLRSDGSLISVKQLITGSDADASVYLPANTTVYVKITSEHNEFSLNPYQIRITESITKQYTYDDANRLTRMEYEQGLYHYEILFNYDKNGNLLKKKTIKTTIN